MFAREKLKSISNKELFSLLAACEDFHERGVLDHAGVRELINEEAKKCNSAYSTFMNSVINDIYREGAMRWQDAVEHIENAVQTMTPNPMYQYHNYVDKHLKEMQNDI
jgi:hypothetical protein